VKVAMELRKLSKGETIEYDYTCPHCKMKSKDVVSVVKHAKIKDFDGSPITISEDLIINIKEVPATEVLKIIEKCPESLNKFNHAFLLASIDSLVIKGDIHTGFTEDEISEWVDDMKPNDYEKLSDMINEKTASVELDRKYKCIKCKEEVQVKFGDLYDFLIF
jgi:DNA-directed RNA polymerase subunit RPC12/RpoP